LLKPIRSGTRLPFPAWHASVRCRLKREAAQILLERALSRKPLFAAHRLRNPAFAIGLKELSLLPDAISL
jgi:hypothetical protein